MKQVYRIKYVFFTLMFIFLQGQIILSQSVDEIIDKHAVAIGGYDMINSVKSIIFAGKFVSDTSVVPVTIIIKGKMIRIDLTIKGEVITEAFDGSTGWFINPFNNEKASAEKMDKEDINEIKETLEWEGKLINYKNKGYEAELVNSEDSSSYKIKLTDKDGNVTFYYLDSSTYLVSRKSNQIKIGDKDITLDMLPGNYRLIDGIMFPMSSVIKTSGAKKMQSATTCTFDKVELNSTIDDKLFKMP